MEIELPIALLARTLRRLGTRRKDRSPLRATVTLGIYPVPVTQGNCGNLQQLPQLFARLSAAGL